MSRGRKRDRVMNFHRPMAMKVMGRGEGSGGLSRRKGSLCPKQREGSRGNSMSTLTLGRESIGGFCSWISDHREAAVTAKEVHKPPKLAKGVDLVRGL